MSQPRLKVISEVTEEDESSVSLVNGSSFESSSSESEYSESDSEKDDDIYSPPR